MIYLDNAATSFPKPEVVYQAMDYVNRNLAFNAGRGGYKSARSAQKLISELKGELCQLVGLKPNENNVVLTESATIASNMVVGGLNLKKSDVVYVTPFEHNAIIRPLELLRKKINFTLKIIPYNVDLSLDKKQLRHMLSIEPCTHIFISIVGNVLGNIVGIDELVSCMKEKPVTIIDASQALGIIPVDYNKLSCDYIIFASHKTLYGPIGLGGIISNKMHTLKPTIVGGTGSDSRNITSERVEDIGSPNIVAVSGLLAAINWIKSIGVEVINNKVVDLADNLRNKLLNIDGVTVYPTSKYNSTGIIAITHNEYLADELSDVLDDEFDIAVRSGFQCAPFVHDLIGTVDTGGVLRISVSWFNCVSESEKIVDALLEIGE